MDTSTNQVFDIHLTAVEHQPTELDPRQFYEIGNDIEYHLRRIAH